jgi:hypothetical protein
MGCFGSRLSKRAKGAGSSHNSVALQFIGGAESGDKVMDEDKLSADFFVLNQKEGETIKELVELYPTEGGKCSDEEKAKAAYNGVSMWCSMHQLEFMMILSQVPKLKSNTHDAIGSKFTGDEIVAQVNNV